MAIQNRKTRISENCSDRFFQDFVKFGIIPEFIGRVPVSVALDRLDEEALKRILTGPKNSIVKQYKKLFELDNIDLKFDEDAIERSKELPVFYEKIAKKYDCIFFNAAKVIESSKVDSLHLMPEAHKKLAEELYKCIMENE